MSVYDFLPISSGLHLEKKENEKLLRRNHRYYDGVEIWQLEQ